MTPAVRAWALPRKRFPAHSHRRVTRRCQLPTPAGVAGAIHRSTKAGLALPLF